MTVYRTVSERLARQLQSALPGIQDTLKGITERNLNLNAWGTSSDFLTGREEAQEEILGRLHQQSPPLPVADFEAVAEGLAEANAKKEARAQHAQETADRAANLLLELTTLMASVETSNRNTERVLVEIKAHREVAAEQQRKQDRINVLLSVAAVLVGLGSIVVPIITGR